MKKNQNRFIAFFPIFKLQCNCVGDNVLGMDYAVSLAFLLQQKYHIPSFCPEKKVFDSSDGQVQLLPLLTW